MRAGHRKPELRNGAPVTSEGNTYSVFSTNSRSAGFFEPSLPAFGLTMMNSGPPLRARRGVGLEKRHRVGLGQDGLVRPHDRRSDSHGHPARHVVERQR